MPTPDIQAQVDALPPVDTSKVSFRITRFQAWPSPQHTTHWRVTVQARVLSTDAVYPFTKDIPIEAVAGKTQAEIVQWLWEQPGTQLAARKLQAGLVGWTPPAPEPVPLPSGDIVGQPFEPAALESPAAWSLVNGG